MNKTLVSVQKLILSLLLLAATTTSCLGSTCVHESDYDKCGNYRQPYPCKLVIHREGDVPLGIRCDNSVCFDLLSSKSLHDETVDCFSQIAVANVSFCKNCFQKKKMRPLEPVTMTKETYLDHSILDLTGNDINDEYVEDYELLTGPINNINVLYLSHNELTKIPIDKISQSVHMRELWLDSNKISTVKFTNNTPIMQECEFVSLRNNPIKKVQWEEYEYWPQVLPNLQILDLGANTEMMSFELAEYIWNFYPLLSRFSKLERLFFPLSEIRCSCPMVAAFARYMKPEFKISTSVLKQYPHMNVLKDHSLNLEEYLDTNRLQRYFSYYENEELVACSEVSEWGFQGEKLQNFRSLSRRICPDISLELEGYNSQ